LSTLPVILLNSEVEEILVLSRSTASGSDAAGLSPQDQERITAALRAELRHTSHCALLTTIEARPALRELVYLEFPRVPVLAYQELSPEMSLQPIARVSLDA
jgi:type III secretion protein V